MRNCFFSLISANLIKCFGTNKVTTFSTLLTAIGLIGFAFAPGLWVMCILAIVFRIGAGAIDVALPPENFGVQVSQSILGVQMSSAYIGIMLTPMFCGILGQTFGMKIFPIYLFLFYCIMLPVTMKAKNLLKNNALLTKQKP